VLFLLLFRISSMVSRVRYPQGMRVKKTPTTRRRFLQMAAGASVISGSGLLPGRAGALAAHASPGSAAAATLRDGRMLIEFDAQMRARIWQVSGRRGPKTALTPWSAADSLTCAGSRLDRFTL